MAIPPLPQLRKPLLRLKKRCSGKLIAVLATMAPSLRASCQVFAVRRLQTLTRIGFPVSLMFRNMVVMTIIANPIQNRV